MASNSLLECLVYAKSASDDIKRNIHNWKLYRNLPPCEEDLVLPISDPSPITELKQCMWNFVGIVRSNSLLERASNFLNLLDYKSPRLHPDFIVNPDRLELRNMLLVANLIVKAAKYRKESRGLHYNLDYKNKVKNYLRPIVLQLSR